MNQYQKLIKTILKYGDNKIDRTLVGTKSIFGVQLRYDLKAGYPLETLKRTYFKAIKEELLWFIRGESNINTLGDGKISIWDEWADCNGDLGRIYGVQWRSWRGYNGEHIDQLQSVIQSLKQTPNSRRHLVSAWNVGDLTGMALPPCHLLFQFYLADDSELSCQVYQRSCDVFLGLPFNIASYALLTHMVAQCIGSKVGNLIMCLGDTHIYNNHINQCYELLNRQPKAMPKLILTTGITNIDGFKSEDIKIENYNSYPTLHGDIAV